jgi:hypothetical protein
MRCDAMQCDAMRSDAIRCDPRSDDEWEVLCRVNCDRPVDPSHDECVSMRVDVSSLLHDGHLRHGKVGATRTVERWNVGAMVSV